MLLYIIALWGSGISQGLMWLSLDDYGQLKYSFIDVMLVSIPYHWIRLIGGLLFLSGVVIMIYNLFRTYLYRKPVLVKIPPVDEKYLLLAQSK